MASMQDDDMYLFDTAIETDPATLAGGDFDAFLDASASPEQAIPADGCLNPNDLIKQEYIQQSPAAHSIQFDQSHRGSESSSSSSEDFKYHERENSEASVSSSAIAAGQGNWGSGINGLSMPANSQLFQDSPMTGMDVEASNKAMNDAFDFETAASTPSGYDAAAATATTHQPKRSANVTRFGQQQTVAPRVSGGAQQGFYIASSREASPLNAMLPGVQAHFPWSKHSPSAGLEETFHNMGVNGDSPGHVTFSPNFNYPGNNFIFEPESSATPSSFTKDVSSPPSTVNSSEPPPKLTVHPTSHKSRVETQIPIKLTLSYLPNGVKKLRLPPHTVSKPKFLAKGEVDKTPEILELCTALVCTSAMQDRIKFERAMARARGEDLAPTSRPSPTSSTASQSSHFDEEKPLNGGEVRICTGCIQRERKRASRKKQKKPEEEEIFQKDEDKRVVVFNTNEMKEWVEASSKDSPASSSTDSATQTPTSGPVQVELPMRIACYCRHQNEKMGFQVIFTIKDHQDKVIAQSITNPIMITDDHKTHNAAPVQTLPGTVPTNAHLPGSGVFQTAGNEMPNGVGGSSKLYKQSFSTTDLKGLENNFNPNFPMAPSSNPFAITSTSSRETSKTLTPKNLSRPPSPSGPSGPSTKKRKQSGSGKLPQGLTMTRLDTAPAGPTSHAHTNSATTSPFALNMNSYMNQPIDRAMVGMPQRNAVNTSPPTPNESGPFFNSNINRSFSLENLPRQAMISAPPSRQPSRPGSPTLGSARNSFGATDATFSQAVSNQLIGQPSRRPSPLIHKLVPAEGSVTGGTEVTLLGNGFYQGLEVMFGDTEATTTTFWGEKCLNCIAPPALSPGTVSVIFKHEHRQYTTMQQSSQHRPAVFTYTDDRELEMFRLALRTIGKQMQHPTDDPYSAAQQLIQGQQQQSMQPMWGGHGGYGMGHQRGMGFEGGPMDTLELESTMVHLLDYMDVRAPTGLKRLDLCRPSGLTLLHLACSLGLTRFAAGLLARGANPNLTDNNGHTPMHHAAMNGHTHIIHRLRMAGASHKARSIRNFTPADLATSLLAYQAVLTPNTHYRSRSVGGTPMRLHSRRNSATSLTQFWENQSVNYADTSSEEDDDEETDAETPTEAVNLTRSLPQSRRGSSQQLKALNIQPAPVAIENGPNGTPSAFMLAWRDHLVNQLQQFNESAQSVMPTLATLNGPLQAMQEYQANPMMRRVSQLFPQRPSSRSNGAPSREGWWETLTGQSSPPPPPVTELPSYKELYPEDGPSAEENDMKKHSAMQAAADAIADSHFEAESSSGAVEQKMAAVPNTIMVNGRRIQRVELKKDRKLFFFWIPVLAIVLALMIRSSGIIELAQSLKTTYLDNDVVESRNGAETSTTIIIDQLVGEGPVVQVA